MGIAHGYDQIVTDNLVLYLDAGNTRSYPGSGNIWYTTTQNKFNCNINQNINYNTPNSGVFVFSGGAGLVPELFISSLAGGFTFESWVLNNSYSGTWAWIIGGSNLNNGQSYAWFQLGKRSGNGNLRFETGSFYSNTYLDTTNVNIADGNYHHIVGTVDLNTMTKSIYIDGVLSVSTSITLASLNLDYGYVTIGAQMRSNSISLLREFWYGNIGSVKIYNRSLTPDEIQKNYNAHKYRYT